VSAQHAKRAIQDDAVDDKLNTHKEKKSIAEVEGVNYKVVWSCLLLVEMIMTNLSAAAHFNSLAANAVGKVAELLRLFNTRSTHLVLGAGAIHSAARLKSINAKHLSMVTQCLGMMTSFFPHIRAALMAQLPSKQHSLLNDLDKIKKDYLDHSEKVLNKFVTIIGGIVEHGLAPRIANTDFDARARDLPMDSPDLACCVFLDGTSTNTRKMHQVLNALLPPDHLEDVFSRIFAYVDQKVPTLFIEASSATNTPNGTPSFQFPTSDDGKRRMILEVECMTNALNGLQGVVAWDFTSMQVLERKLEYKLPRAATQEAQTEEEDQVTAEEETKEDAAPTSTTDASQPDSSDAAPTSTTDPSESDSSDAAQTSTTDDSQPDSSDAAQTSTTDPSEPDSSDAAQTSTPDTSQPDSSDAVQTSTTDPSQPDSSDAQNGEVPTESVDANGTTESKAPLENGESASDEGKTQANDG
jgi:vacuolar protein sorting-associated protein 54